MKVLVDIGKTRSQNKRRLLGFLKTLFDPVVLYLRRLCLDFEANRYRTTTTIGIILHQVEMFNALLVKRRVHGFHWWAGPLVLLLIINALEKFGDYGIGYSRGCSSNDISANMIILYVLSLAYFLEKDLNVSIL